jgi:hypothetical protein
MIGQLNLQTCGINPDDFGCMFERSLSHCLTSEIKESLKGKKIMFTMDEKNLLPVDGWGIRASPYCTTPITTIQPIVDNTTMVSAIDSSTIKIAETEEGSLYGVKSGIAISKGGHALMHFKIGPILFYLSEQTIRNSEIDHRLAKLVLVDSDFAKRMIRLRFERAIQIKLSIHFDKSILLIDGSLKSSLLEDRSQNIRHVAENCSLQQNSIIGISKNTRFKILNKISNPLAKIRTPAYIDVDLIIKSLVRNSIGNSLLVKFGNNNSTVLRADVVNPNYNKDESLGKLLGNDSIAQGYPETLRLAHHISTFTNTEISCLKGHVLSNFDVTEIASEDIRNNLLGSIPV